MSSTAFGSLMIPPELEAEMTPAVRGIVQTLLDEIAGLKARVGSNPQNASLPPSTQHPHARPQPPKRKSKRKRGGQPGREKHERPLVPTEPCDDVRAIKPTECRRCSHTLVGSDPEPLRHQVWELPEIKPRVTEFPLHRLECNLCGETTCAELPVGVPRGQSLSAVDGFHGAVDGLHGAVDGLLSPEQAADGRVPQHAPGAAVLRVADGEDRKPGDGGAAAALRDAGRRTAGAGAVEPRRDADQGSQRQGVAVDVRGPAVHGVQRAGHARGHGLDHAAGPTSAAIFKR
jgi:hypothetical protein